MPTITSSYKRAPRIVLQHVISSTAQKESFRRWAGCCSTSGYTCSRRLGRQLNFVPSEVKLVLMHRRSPTKVSHGAHRILWHVTEHDKRKRYVRAPAHLPFILNPRLLHVVWFWLQDCKAIRPTEQAQSMPGPVVAMRQIQPFDCPQSSLVSAACSNSTHSLRRSANNPPVTKYPRPCYVFLNNHCFRLSCRCSLCFGRARTCSCRIHIRIDFSSRKRCS